MKDNVAALMLQEWATGEAGSDFVLRCPARWCMVEGCTTRLADGNFDVVCRMHQAKEFAERVRIMTTPIRLRSRLSKRMERVNEGCEYEAHL